MNAKDLSLEYIIVGPRGSGKTLLLTHFVLEYLQDAWLIDEWKRRHPYSKAYNRRKVNVWSTYPVRALWESPTGEPVWLEPLPLDVEQLIIWHPDLHDGIIFFDEIDQVADRQDWFSTVGKLLTAGVQVMRHRNLSIIASIQSLNWLNARLQWQADIIIKMRDLAFTPWGRAKHLQLGEVASATWLDKSGIMTGYPYEENFKTYPLLFFGKRYWNYYSTLHDFNILELKTKYQIKQPKKIIDMSGETEAEIRNQECLDNTMGFFVYSNQGEAVKADNFYRKAKEFGFDGNHITAGKYMRGLGAKSKVRSGQTIYNFDEVTLA